MDSNKEAGSSPALLTERNRGWVVYGDGDSSLGSLRREKQYSERMGGSERLDPVHFRR